MKRLSAKTYAQLYQVSVAAVKPGQHQQVAQKFLQLLRRHRALKLMPRILTHLQQLDDVAQKRIRVAVTATNATVADSLTQQLQTIFPSVALDLTVDPTLRGGLVLRVGDDEIDGSLRTRLRRLHHHLTNA